MLKSISLHNFALVEQLDLQFDAGLHLLTGDTGAGKSLLFDALHLLAGQKSDAIWVREDAAKADLRCELMLRADWPADQALMQFLQEHELEDEDNPTLVRLRRVIHRDGRSKAQINGVPVKAAILKQVTENRFLFHDQHESLELLKPDSQLNWLDQVAGNQLDLDSYSAAFSQWTALVKEQQELQAAQRLAAQRQDYLAFQLDEMAELNLDPEQLSQMEARLKAGDHASRWQAQAADLEQILSSENEGLRLLRLWAQQVDSDKNPHPKCQAAAKLLESAFIYLDEAQDEVGGLGADLDFDEELTVQAQQILSKVFDLSRKHQVAVADLQQFRAEIEQELASLGTNDERLAALAKEIAVAWEKVQILGDSLRQSRLAAVPGLVDLLTAHLRLLGMPKTQWDIQVQPAATPKLNGLDDVVFLMSSNEGHRPQPLGKIASGGELSRISLVLHAFARGSLKNQNISGQRSQLYFFDEVDVGVSGQVAAAIGMILKQLAVNYQVFCISHSPQVAAQPGSHWRAAKHLGEGQRVATQWVQLDQKQRLHEVARMLGTASKPELALAKKMLSGATAIPEL